jgi:hypothetical protein
MLGEGEGRVEFYPEDPVGFRGVNGGDGGVVMFMVTKWFCRRDARRVRLAKERALSLLHSAPVMQIFER